MKINELTLTWLVDTKNTVDQTAAALKPEFGWCGTEHAMWALNPSNRSISKVFELAGIEEQSIHNTGILDSRGDLAERSALAEQAPLILVQSFRDLLAIQPLYLLNRVNANETRISAQARLICSLYRLSLWLEPVEDDVIHNRRGLTTTPNPFIRQCSAYLLAELEAARKAGVIPLGKGAGS